MDLDIPGPGGRLRVRRWGAPEAPLVVGVPGLTGTVVNFDHLGSRIGGDDLQLVALDLRGRGHSTTSEPGSYGWANHARDVLAVADALGFERLAIVGQSMGGSIAMKVAELDASRLRAVVLVDVAGRVDPGVGPVIAEQLGRIGRVFPSPEHYLAEIRSAGLVDPWSDDWEQTYRYDLETTAGGVRTRTSAEAVAEDRAYTLTQDPYERWRHLTMPTLLVRATRELRPGAGHVVPVADRDEFVRTVPQARVIEVDANHLTVNTHPDLARSAPAFLLEDRP